MIDPIAYKTSGFYLRHYGRRLPRAESWKNALMGENNYVKRMRERLAEPAVEMVSDSSQDDDVAGLPRWPNRQQFGAALARTLEREARLLFIYTGGMEDYNYDKQFEDTFPDAAQSPFLSVHYLQEADHVFSTEDSRIVLFQLLKRWLKQAGFVTESEQQAIS